MNSEVLKFIGSFISVELSDAAKYEGILKHVDVKEKKLVMKNGTYQKKFIYFFFTM